MIVLFILFIMFLVLFVTSILIAYIIAKHESKYAGIAMLVTGCIGAVAVVLATASLFSNI